jgi:hypothetical protein
MKNGGNVWRNGQRLFIFPERKMTKPLPRASVPFSEPADQLGCVVPDLGAAISEWVAKDVGPFLTLPGVTLDCSYRGRKSKPKIGVAFSQQGDLQIELIQPLNDEPSTYRDFLAAGGKNPALAPDEHRNVRIKRSSQRSKSFCSGLSVKGLRHARPSVLVKMLDQFHILHGEIARCPWR